MLTKKPMILVFAGPNGSGKSFITGQLQTIGAYINADDIKKAKAQGFFIKCFYVLTANPGINKARVRERVLSGGHDVPPEIIVDRYYKSLKMIPELLEICDVCHIYDNTIVPVRIAKKRKEKIFYWENEFWKKQDIEKLIAV